MKKCIKCGEEKPDECFYRQAGGKGGRRGTCGPCATAYYRAYVEMKVRKNPDYVKETSRRNRRNKKENPTGMTKTRAVVDRHKVKVRSQTRCAVLRGDILRGPCSECGATDRVHAHHEDYSRPLDIIWLCKACHSKRHAEINEVRRLSVASGD